MRALTAVLISALLVTAACSHDRQDDRPSPPPAASGGSGADVRIQTTTAQLDLALTGDTISAGLAGDALAKARQATDTLGVHATGLGGSIERMVKSTVQSAVTHRVTFPVSDVRDVRYEDGEIRFEWNRKPTSLFDQTKINGKPFLASFRPDDAERFVQAVRARLRPAQ
jgi:hypothetical protein